MGTTHSRSSAAPTDFQKLSPSASARPAVKAFVDPRSPVAKQQGFNRTPLAERRNFNGVSHLQALPPGKRGYLAAKDPRSPTVPRSPVDRAPEEERQSP
eukprot:CAMPEP_0173379120 /NCGR_PEP_ID=MMETSP1356-20130122/2184_1 /TAXON_ID=77927 ORGANISM="Hemiselmis virescens, Strain PCC157" /NCGR_SAMPLE_ID=MMETSP1356 /ASSEMBLY_ACC=CAM_ASM_000847 /LENGTH=98 /DNA_ID=CAMNT_0014332403 /DNA_START=130 /DNA_END=426 /DNA_ORIENTATION=-